MIRSLSFLFLLLLCRHDIYIYIYRRKENGMDQREKKTGMFGLVHFTK